MNEGHVGAWVRWGDVEDAIDDAVLRSCASSTSVARKDIRESVVNHLDGYTPHEAAEMEAREARERAQSDAPGGQSAPEGRLPVGQDPPEAQNAFMDLSVEAIEEATVHRLHAELPAGAPFAFESHARAMRVIMRRLDGVDIERAAVVLLASLCARDAGHSRMLPVMSVVGYLAESGQMHAARGVHDTFVDCRDCGV